MRGVRRVSVFAALVAALLVFGVGSANAAILTFTATLSGANEVPPSGSAGTGTATVTWDTTTNMMTVSVSFSGLVSTTVSSHIHCCIPPSPPDNAIVATTVPTFPGFPLGVTSGTYLMTFDMTLASSYNPAFITAHGGTVSGAMAALLAGLQAGQTYLNIHTFQFPGGEIRGQLALTTAVRISTTSALRTPRGVLVRWRTASDIDTLGFHVYRQVNGKRTRVNRTLIVGKGRGLCSFLDRKAPEGKTLRYWIQVVELDGSRTWHGPVRIRSST